MLACMHAAVSMQCNAFRCWVGGWMSSRDRLRSGIQSPIALHSSFVLLRSRILPSRWFASCIVLCTSIILPFYSPLLYSLILALV
jgi:hypothetical protein